MILVLILCIVWTAAIVYWVFTPSGDDRADLAAEARRFALEDRKKAVYENLRDLHFEHLAGKLSAEDYRETRRSLELEAAGVIAQLESSPPA